MSAEIKQHSTADVTLIRSSGGIFDIHLDGELIFSKQRSSRFPDPGEIIDLLPSK